MNFLEALFAGAKAIVREVAGALGAIVREVLHEVDRSAFGRSVTRLVDGVSDRHFSKARDLADEERELQEKTRRDRRTTEADQERLRAIEEERHLLREEMERANAERAAQDLRERADETHLAELDDDEISASVGILSSRECPTCQGAMRIRQGALDSQTGIRKFFWQCTEPRFPPCPTLKLDPTKTDARVLRTADTDLDTPKAVRRTAWARPDVVAETHGRVRQHLGDDDKQLVCPNHLLPLKLLQKRSPGGKVLDSYEYVCLGVSPDGSACTHTITLQTMPQVAAMLRRTEGEGILRH